MRHLTSIVLLTLFFIFALAGTILAADEGNQTESPKEEQVIEQALDDKGDVDAVTDNEETSWSNVKALWG